VAAGSNSEELRASVPRVHGAHARRRELVVPTVTSRLGATIVVVPGFRQHQSSKAR
jgi:hypothetical protein